MLPREYLELWKQWGVETPLGRTFPVAKPAAQNHWKNAPKPSQVNTMPAPLSEPAKPPTQFQTLDEVRTWLGECTRCGLCRDRKQIVFGDGTAKSPLLFVGEGPGAEEDEQGLPFVGKAGQLLTKIIEAMGYKREAFYIANTVKCRPPENRAPTFDEIQQCLPFLKAQIDVIQPKYIIALGLHAATTLTGQNAAISNLRGRFHKLAWNPDIMVMPTYHPAYLLRNPAAKKMVWDDVKQVKTKLDQLL